MQLTDVMFLKISFYFTILATCCNNDPITENSVNNSTLKRLHVGFLWPRNLVGLSVPVAFKIGLAMAKQNLPEYEISYSMKDSKCNSKAGIKEALNLQKVYPHLDAIIGSQCSTVCEPVGLLSTVWNIPQVSSRCTSILLSNKTVYPTFSRVRGTSLYTSRVVMNVLKSFGWMKASIISSEDPVFKLSAKYLITISEEHDMDIQLYTFSTTVIGESVRYGKLDILRSLIHVMKETSRVALLFMYYRDLRNFLVLAKQEGFLNRNYVFIGLDSTYRGSNLVSRYIEPQITDIEIYQGIISVTEDDPPITEQWEKITNETLRHYSRNNVSRQEMQTTIEKNKQFSGKEE